jgi:hypothetical protein
MLGKLFRGMVIEASLDPLDPVAGLEQDRSGACLAIQNNVDNSFPSTSIIAL